MLPAHCCRRVLQPLMEVVAIQSRRDCVGDPCLLLGVVTLTFPLCNVTLPTQ
jgi:hypothetical protein